MATVAVSTSAPAARADARSLAKSGDRWLWLPIACIWGMMTATFSVPGREGPSTLGGIDVIALVKILIRVFSCIGLAGLLIGMATLPRRRTVILAALPLLLFGCWAVLSVVWSPLKVVSIGQVIGLWAVLLLALVIGLLCEKEQAISRILFHLVLSLLVISTILVVVDRFVSRDMSGLDRSAFVGADNEGDYGLYHPTAAGSTGSLGFILLIAARFLWKWRWTKILFIPGILIFGVLVLLAASRTAAFLTVALGGLAIPILLSTRQRGWLLLGAGVLGCLYLGVDPEMRLLEDGYDEVQSYVRRGESAEMLKSLTGRTDMWDAMWKSYWGSPIVGYGYFVSSRTGELDVWTGPSNWTAHNMLLQVLVSTGAVGLTLFCTGLAYLAWCIVGALIRNREESLGFLLGMVWLWYAGWGSLSEAFMGPLRPETVVFFATLGLGLGQLRSTRPSIRLEGNG